MTIQGPVDHPRVCLFVGRHPHPGQTFINRHIEHLFGGNTCLICMRHSGESPYGKAVYDISQGRTLGWRRSMEFPMRLLNNFRFGTKRVFIGQEKAAIRDYLLREGVDVLLCELGEHIPKITRLARELGIPCFGYFRGRDATEGLRSARRAKGYRVSFPHLEGVIAVSQFLLDNLAAVGLTHPNSHVIPSGVDIRRFRPGEKVPGSCLAVGRMVAKKAPLTTLRAFAAATSDQPNARLRFIGDGPLFGSAKTLAVELGVADKVQFDGQRDHEVVREALATSALFLQHSVVSPTGDAEGLPTAIQEALAAGCITVSTRHAGIPEAIDHGVDGLICEEHDLAGFTDLIGRALSDEAAPMALAARRTAEARFDNAVLLHRLEDVLRGQEAAEPRASAQKAAS